MADETTIRNIGTYLIGLKELPDTEAHRFLQDIAQKKPFEALAFFKAYQQRPFSQDIVAMAKKNAVRQMTDLDMQDEKAVKTFVKNNNTEIMATAVVNYPSVFQTATNEPNQVALASAHAYPALIIRHYEHSTGSHFASKLLESARDNLKLLRQEWDSMDASKMTLGAGITGKDAEDLANLIIPYREWLPDSLIKYASKTGSLQAIRNKTDLTAELARRCFNQDGRTFTEQDLDQVSPDYMPLVREAIAPALKNMEVGQTEAVNLYRDVNGDNTFSDYASSANTEDERMEKLKHDLGRAFGNVLVTKTEDGAILNEWSDFPVVRDAAGNAYSDNPSELMLVTLGAATPYMRAAGIGRMFCKEKTNPGQVTETDEASETSIHVVLTIKDPTIASSEQPPVSPRSGSGTIRR